MVGVPRPVDHPEDGPRRGAREGRLVAGYDDELWRSVAVDRGPAPPHLVDFVRSLGDAGRVLDLGAGDGRLAAAFAARELTLADTSAVALERARDRLPTARVVHLEPDAPLPLADAEFDLVACVKVLDHVRDVQLLLSEARRVLRPGGRLAVATPAHGRIAGLDVLLRGFERRFDPRSSQLRFLTRGSLARLLDELGFDDVAIRRRRGDLLAMARRP